MNRKDLTGLIPSQIDEFDTQHTSGSNPETFGQDEEPINRKLEAFNASPALLGQQVKTTF